MIFSEVFEKMEEGKKYNMKGKNKIPGMRCVLVQRTRGSDRFL